MTIATFSIPNISCNHCVHTIQTEVADLEGVQRVDADLNAKIVKVEFQTPASEELIVHLLKEINYPPE